MELKAKMLQFRQALKPLFRFDIISARGRALMNREIQSEINRQYDANEPVVLQEIVN
jgi:hypothetical protein